MSEEGMKNSLNVDYWPLAIVMAIALFYGEPDLIDSTIALLQALAKYLLFLSGGAV